MNAFWMLSGNFICRENPFRGIQLKAYRIFSSYFMIIRPFFIHGHPCLGRGEKPRVPFETRARRVSDWCIRVTTKARRRAPRLAPLLSLFFFSIASTPVIRQLAKEIRIHNSNRFSFPPRPAGSSYLRRHARVSKLLSLRVHKVDWTVARMNSSYDPPLVYIRAAAVSQLTRKFARMRAESMTVRGFVSRKLDDESSV